MSTSRSAPPAAPSATELQPTFDAETQPGRAASHMLVMVPPPNPTAATRYLSLELLGRGGMGEVRLCFDAHVGREIAVKWIAPAFASDDEIRRRFLNEARVQGRLEHPSIVPVYDIGSAPDGTAFFTMKRVKGLTLWDVLDRLRRGDPEADRRYSRRKLLTAFGSICLAVDYAHEQGVVHRDLKPPNVMLGDWGEVHVLDWGIAKVLDGDAAPITVVELDEVPPSGRAAVIGTPGYLPPEQLTGGAVGPWSDVYALGAILFELLTLVPLHTGDTNALLSSTLKGADARASVRAPERDVPPELEALCVKATATAPADRFASARELHEAIERYLDGDRDLERRRVFSAAHAAAANAAASQAIDGEDPDNAARSRAMREIGQALALDHENVAARSTLARLLLNPPRQTPPDARVAMEQSKDAATRVDSRMGAFAFASWFALFPLLVLLGLRSYTWVAVASAAFGAAAVFSALQARDPAKKRRTEIFLAAGVGFFALSRLFGPLVFVPTAALGLAITFAANHFSTRERRIAIALAVAAVAVPAGLEAAGVLPRSYAYPGGGMLIVSQLANLSGPLAEVFLVFANLLLIVLLWLLVRRTAIALGDAETRLTIQAWHLRLMVPPEARHAVQAPTVRDGRVFLAG